MVLYMYSVSELTALMTCSREFGDILLQASSHGSVLQEFTDVLGVFVQLQKGILAISCVVGTLGWGRGGREEERRGRLWLCSKVLCKF